MMIRIRQLLRYGTVSLIATSISMIVLGTLVTTRWATPGWANVIATAVGTVPSFELNRRWVWNCQGRRRLAAEIAPFCVLSLTALGLSTVAVSVVGRWAVSLAVSGATRTLMVEAANVAAFGSMWVLQFVILDRCLFKARSQPALVGATDPGRIDDRSAMLEAA